MNKVKVTNYFVLFVMFCMVLSVPSTARGAEKVSSVTLTEEEQEFVDRGEEIVIGCWTQMCPLLYQDEKTGELKGITIDVLDMVSEETGLKFRYEPLEAESVITHEGLRRMQVDLVASVEYHSVNEKSPGILLSDAYLKTQKVFACKKGVVFDTEKDMVVAVASASKTLSAVLRDRYPHFKVDYYRSTEDALTALQEGKADAVLQNQYTMERILARPVYENLQVVDAAAIGDYHCLGALVPINELGKSVVEDQTKLLLSILNKGIDHLDGSRVSFSVIKQTAENTYRFSLNDILYRYRYPLVIIVVSVILIFVLLGQVFILQKKREEQLVERRRNRELSLINEQLEKQQILLKDALVRAEEGSRIKSSFLFNMSHDIRTPMNAILGLTNIALQHRDDPERMIESLQKIDASSRNLLQLLNDVLDMSRLDSGKVVLAEQPCDLFEIFRNVGEILQDDIEQKKLTVCKDASGVKNRRVYGDPARLDQILLNIMSNAVKFSKPGGKIHVLLKQEDSGMEKCAMYELHVRDEGIGMSRAFQRHVFEPFERERSSTVSGMVGTGLGMSITRSLVDLMGGTIEVSSEPDQGTEVVVRIALREQEAYQAGQKKAGKAQEQKENAADFSGKRALLVEDNEINLEIAQEILKEVGFLVETAENGKIAVEKVRDSQPGYYDMVLMDIQMPVMDGYEAARQIRKLEVPELADIPIIALTANAFDEDKRAAMESGMNAHVAKPIDIPVLLSTLARY